MVITASKPKAWAQAIATPANEFAATPLSVKEGKIPAELQGSLYRNGPARLSRNNLRVGHWFDGDGAILGIHFANSQATGVYRYVQTQGYLAEEKANAFIYSNYGMTAAGAFWNNWLKPIKNTANTSVLALPDRLLALWEGGKPHALDLENLQTTGEDNLDSLQSNQAFSAHPKVEPRTGSIFNYGVTPGFNSTLWLYRCNSEGKIVEQNSHRLAGLPLIHDFCLAGKYLVFLIPPVRVALFSTALGQQSFSDAMEWKPELGTEILVFDSNDLSLVSRHQTEAWFQWHFANGYINQDDQIVVEFTRYENFATNRFLKEVASGQAHTSAPGTLCSLVIEPQTAKVISNQKLSTTCCEFPQVAPARVGQNWRYTYLNVHRYGVTHGEELFNAIACFDRHTRNMAIADLGANLYPTEPILVTSSEDPEQGWLLTVVYDGNRHCSEVWIYPSNKLFAPPVCRIALPSVVPPSFHGIWRPKSLS